MEETGGGTNPREKELVALAAEVKKRDDAASRSRANPLDDATREALVKRLFGKLSDPANGFEYARIAAKLEHVDILEMDIKSSRCCGHIVAESSIRACHDILENATVRDDDSETTRALKMRLIALLTCERRGENTVRQSIDDHIARYVKKNGRGDTTQRIARFEHLQERLRKDNDKKHLRAAVRGDGSALTIGSQDTCGRGRMTNRA